MKLCKQISYNNIWYSCYTQFSSFITWTHKTPIANQLDSMSSSKARISSWVHFNHIVLQDTFLIGY